MKKCFYFVMCVLKISNTFSTHYTLAVKKTDKSYQLLAVKKKIDEIISFLKNLATFQIRQENLFFFWLKFISVDQYDSKYLYFFWYDIFMYKYPLSLRWSVNVSVCSSTFHVVVIVVQQFRSIERNGFSKIVYNNERMNELLNIDW